MEGPISFWGCKEQESNLILPEHDDDDDNRKNINENIWKFYLHNQRTVTLDTEKLATKKKEYRYFVGTQFNHKTLKKSRRPKKTSGPSKCWKFYLNFDFTISFW